MNRMSLALNKGCPDPDIRSLILMRQKSLIYSFGHLGATEQAVNIVLAYNHLIWMKCSQTHPADKNIFESTWGM